MAVKTECARGSSTRAAALALLAATAIWGCSFTWGKSAGESINGRALLASGAALGPMLVMACRFTLGGALWMLWPRTWRGWTWGSVRRSVGLGILLAGGIGLQLLGLDRTSAAINAFLTSLSVLFVPILMAVVVRRAPRRVVWVGVALAVVGVWMMTGAATAGFGPGEVLGVACSIVYSVYIIAVNLLLQREDGWRVTAGHLVVVGVIGWGVCLGVDHGPGGFSVGRVVYLVSGPGVAGNLMLLGVLATGWRLGC